MDGLLASIEQDLSCLIRTILCRLPVGRSIPESEYLRAVVSRLTSLVTTMLREVHAQWKHESLDDILPLVTRKTGVSEIQIIGHCILISDQTLAPIHLIAQVSPNDDEITYMECRLGERGPGGMIRTPYTASFPSSRKLLALESQPDRFNWMYKLAFGEKTQNQLDPIKGTDY